MKTITVILSILLIAAIILFGITAGKALSGAQDEDEDTCCEKNCRRHRKNPYRKRRRPRNGGTAGRGGT